MEHDDFSGDISSDIEDNFSDEHEHESKSEECKLEMIAFGIFKNGTYKSLLKLCSKSWNHYEKYFYFL